MLHPRPREEALLLRIAAEKRVTLWPKQRALSMGMLGMFF
jgi:hypothetical protein